MTYLPPRHIAVVNMSTLAEEREVAFWVEAVGRQLIDVALAWNFAPPGIALYSRDVEIPRREGAIIALADSDGDPNTAGYHTPWGAIIDMSQSPSPSRTLSHEAVEMAVNFTCDRWAQGPKGRRYAVEIADPVQRQSYVIPVELFGVKSMVHVSNWVTPAWYQVGALPRYDWGQRLASSYELGAGGYAIAQEADGEVLVLAHPEGAAFGARKFRGSRTQRIITQRLP